MGMQPLQTRFCALMVESAASAAAADAEALQICPSTIPWCGPLWRGHVVQQGQKWLATDLEWPEDVELSEADVSGAYEVQLVSVNDEFISFATKDGAIDHGRCSRLVRFLPPSPAHDGSWQVSEAGDIDNVASLATGSYMLWCDDCQCPVDENPEKLQTCINCGAHVHEWLLSSQEQFNRGRRNLI